MVSEGYVVKWSGGLMSKEPDGSPDVFNSPAKPVLAIPVGAKVGDEIQLIRNMLDKADKMNVGGGMAYTSLKVNDKMENAQAWPCDSV